MLFIGCEKNDSSRIETAVSLTGTWRWDKTQGGIANHILETPASTGKNISLELKANGTYSFYLDGAVSSSGTYQLMSRQCIHDQTQKTVIDFSATGDADVMIEVYTRQNLQVSDEAFDGTGMFYTHIN